MPIVKSMFSPKHNGVVGDFSNLPSFKEARKKVIECTSPVSWHRPAFAILLITGCRRTELVALRKRDITWFDKNKEPVVPDEDISNVALVYFNLTTLKRRGDNRPMRRFPVLNDVRYNDLLKIVWRYWACCPDEDFMLFEGKNGLAVWRAMKKYLDIDYYPHLFRHISATYYAQNGVIGAGLKKRFGWAKETSAEPYVNLNDDYLLDKEYEISKKETAANVENIIFNKIKDKINDTKPVSIKIANNSIDTELNKIVKKTFKQVQQAHEELVL